MPTEQMTIYVPPRVKKEIKQLAVTREQSMNTIVVEALEFAIANWMAQNGR
ncbi:MAG: hypothetical protein AAGA46_07660 [Cyanobacteria bacterium P01_F01_bin.13]